jgi:osmotically-inducible protein OsmY
MVRVDFMTTDKITAWQIRDRLACHPLLGGAAAQISISASHEHVILSGWTGDERLLAIAARMAQGAAGRRLVSVKLNVGDQCRQPASSAGQDDSF